MKAFTESQKVPDLFESTTVKIRFIHSNTLLFSLDSLDARLNSYYEA